MTERCPRCDRPEADKDTMAAVCPGGLECNCRELFPGECLGVGTPECTPIDWRARCLAAETSKRIDDMLERRVAKANRIAADATSIARRALVEGLAECERLRAMDSTLSAFDILIGAPSKEMTEADIVEAMVRLVTDPPSPMMDAREGAAAREQAIRADSAREERERVVGHLWSQADAWCMAQDELRERGSDLAHGIAIGRTRAYEEAAGAVTVAAHAPGKGGDQ